MMELITLIPAIACIYVIFRRGTYAAFLYVFLPVLLLLPTYFWFALRPLPSINFVDAALLPLGAGMLLFDVSRWKFTRTDLWMLVFLFTSGYAEYRMGLTTNSAFSYFAALVTGLIPYMAGKLLIEQTGSRVKVFKIFVWCLTISSFVSSYEYFFKRNPYGSFWNHFYPTQWSTWVTQVRWGFGRVAGPYSQSELAGMIVLTAWLMSLWLGRNNFQENEARTPPPTLLKHGRWHIWILFVALFMTQARGPWIGALLGVSVAAIGMARRPLRRAIIVGSLVFLIGAPLYIYGKDYLSGPRRNYGSEKETAQYRAELLDNYIPLAKKGGPWGWGLEFPKIGGQDSVDNEYLLAWIIQGYVGATALILLMLETVGRLVVQTVRARTVRDRHFVLTLLGIVVAIAFTLSTVFLGSQSYELLFLLIGWSQAVQPREKMEPVREARLNEAASEAGLMRVYS